jgi:hypothetical protein
MLGHLGINVPDLAVAMRYYDALMPLVGFEPFFHTDDEFSYRLPTTNPAPTCFSTRPPSQASTQRSERACNTWRSSCGADP